MASRKLLEVNGTPESHPTAWGLKEIIFLRTNPKEARSSRAVRTKSSTSSSTKLQKNAYKVLVPTTAYKHVINERSCSDFFFIKRNFSR